MQFNSKTLLTVFFAFSIGLWWAGGSWQPSPYLPIPVPSPAPQADRPVLRFLSRIAKTFLWVALVAEKPPTDPQPDHRLVQAPAIGEDGYPMVDNARGW